MSKPPTPPAVVLLEVDKVRTDGGTQARAKIHGDTVAEYADVLKEGGSLAPAVVFFDGRDYWLGDGFHTHAAHRRAGLRKIRCEVRQGARRDAVLFAAGANATHGLRRTREDKQRAVDLLLNDPEWGKWSSRQVAKAAGVSHTMVDEVRRQRSEELLQRQQARVARQAKQAVAADSDKDDDADDADAPQDAGAPSSAGGSAGGNFATADEAAAEPDVLVDGRGRPIEQERVRAAFEQLPRFKEVEQALAKLTTLLVELATDKTCNTFFDPTDVSERLKAVRDAVRYAKPYAVCPYCSGTGCRACMKGGYLPRPQWDKLPPKELKQLQGVGR